MRVELFRVYAEYDDTDGDIEVVASQDTIPQGLVDAVCASVIDVISDYAEKVEKD